MQRRHNGRRRSRHGDGRGRGRADKVLSYVSVERRGQRCRLTPPATVAERDSALSYYVVLTFIILTSGLLAGAALKERVGEKRIQLFVQGIFDVWHSSCFTNLSRTDQKRLDSAFAVPCGLVACMRGLDARRPLRSCASVLQGCMKCNKTLPGDKVKTATSPLSA